MELKLPLFGERLRLLRQEHKLTQRQMAALFDITERNYQRWESGQVDPTGRALIFLGDYFHVSVDYLLGRTDRRDMAP